MFSKALLVAFLYLSLATSSLAISSHDVLARAAANAKNSKANSVATCPTGVATVTVTARATAATTNAAAAGGKGGNNAGNAAGAAGNNNTGNKGNTGNTGKTGTGNTGNNAGNTGNNAGNTGNTGNAGNAAGGNPQTSLTLDPRVIATGFQNNGQDVPAAGQVASATSSNNFINFCVDKLPLPITNGKQIVDGSCNPAPMGAIPAKTKMPSGKFVVPANGATIKANTAFTVQFAIKNLETGFFVNAQENYFSAPQNLNAQGIIQGHSHVVIEKLTSLGQTTPTDPTKFEFFKGLNDKAVNGVLTADVTDGLAAGVYRIASINSAANHQPVLAPVAQHGSLDDIAYFTVTANGAAGNGAAAGGAATGGATTGNTGKTGTAAGNTGKTGNAGAGRGNGKN